MAIKRLRVIAGPNGSGKSTLFSLLKNQVKVGAWVNADELLNHITIHKTLDYDIIGFKATQKDFKTFRNRKTSVQFLEEFAIENEIDGIVFGRFTIAFSDAKFSNQSALFLSDFFRFYLLKKDISFTTETVFSHPSKLALLQQARKAGFKTYLYFIATEKAEINIGRISGRVFKGGHNVSSQKIRDRFPRSLAMLSEAIPFCDRVYVFDNTQFNAILVASFLNGKLNYIMPGKVVDWVNNIITNHL